MANIRQSGAHQFRHHIDTPNADPAKKSRNHTFYGSGNLGKDVQSRLEQLTKLPRKNAVLAMDGLVSLSPKLLKTKINLNVWAKGTLNWLQKRFGENLVSAVVHLDESSPHMHFTVIPLDQKADGRKVLNARDMFNKWQLADMQRSYNETMQKHIPEVAPPKYGSKASHTSIKTFYAELEEIRQGLRLHSKAVASKKIIANATKLHFASLIEKCVEDVERTLGCELDEDSRAQIIHDNQEILKAALSNWLEPKKLFKLLDSNVEALIKMYLNKRKLPQHHDKSPPIGKTNKKRLN
ncbi:plasmid recombination protein [Vibrio splendidus]|nr:plasmid recombination protein [Vibrio splendidus]